MNTYSNKHCYNTRLNNFNKNKDSILTHIKGLIDLDWQILTKSEKVNRFNEVFLSLIHI